jgi:hypothetical protein
VISSGDARSGGGERPHPSARRRPRRRSELALRPCDSVTVHFAGDGEVHLFPRGKRGQIAARLAALAAMLMENPSAIAKVAGAAPADRPAWM